MSEPSPRLILASASPRRRDLLREAGLAHLVMEPGIREDELPGESPEQLARRLALEKARAVAWRVVDRSAATCVLGADTIVVLDQRMLGKPRDAHEAAAMLLELAGRTHRVLSGFAVVAWRQACAPVEQSGVEESRVTLRAVTPEEARAYAASGEPLDKAGAYALQGLGGRFVERVEGSRSNVIGLPLEVVLPRLARLGIACPG